MKKNILMLLIFGMLFTSCAEKEQLERQDDSAEKVEPKIQSDTIKKVENEIKKEPTFLDSISGYYVGENYKITFFNSDSGKFWGHFQMAEGKPTYHKSTISKIILVDSNRIEFELDPYDSYRDKDFTDKIGIISLWGFHAVIYKDHMFLYDYEFPKYLEKLKRLPVEQSDL